MFFRTFKQIFFQYYEALKLRYLKISMEARMKAAYKIAKPVAKIENEKKETENSENLTPKLEN